MSVHLNNFKQNVTSRSVLTPGLVDFQKLMLSDRYHLTASTLGRVCPLMMGLMLWISSFSCCRASLLLLLLNVFLKVRAVYFRMDSTISGVFQYSVRSAGTPPTCTSSTINFLGVEGPFLGEVNPSRAVWCIYCLAGCVGAFLQLLNCFCKLLAQLMVLPQFGHFFFLMGGSQWCCLSAASLEKNLVHLLNLCLVPLHQTFHRLLNLTHLAISRCKYGFELIIG